MYDEQPSQPKRKRGNQQSHVTAIDLGSDDDVVEEPKRAPKAPPEEPKKLELQTKRTMLGTWDCGPATVTFTAEKIQWFPAEGRALPGTGEYPLISISLSTITAFEIDKQNGGLGIWSLAQLPFQAQLGERWSPMWSHNEPQSSIFIQYDPGAFRGSWPSQIAVISQKMKKLSKFVGPGLISGRHPLREGKKERKGQVAPLEMRQQSRGSQQMNKALAEQRDDKPQPPGVPWFPRPGCLGSPAKARNNARPRSRATHPRGGSTNQAYTPLTSPAHRAAVAAPRLSRNTLHLRRARLGATRATSATCRRGATRRSSLCTRGWTQRTR